MIDPSLLQISSTGVPVVPASVAKVWLDDTDILVPKLFSTSNPGCENRQVCTDSINEGNCTNHAQCGSSSNSGACHNYGNCQGYFDPK